jgi:hypothetical protein
VIRAARTATIGRAIALEGRWPICDRVASIRSMPDIEESSIATHSNNSGNNKLKHSPDCMSFTPNVITGQSEYQSDFILTKPCPSDHGV